LSNRPTPVANSSALTRETYLRPGCPPPATHPARPVPGPKVRPGTLRLLTAIVDAK
jgi:hypothetical protein